ncbi:2OG-Fe(II) oxygenase [Wenxinia marina]|uniref:Putative iron-regulated protein n=1 Tax=Wenxinia marina DSM 24838 TaxID=1123501 RepID=A0A0D0QDP3_9RHOB|nr:2OG-Fe(II) oxygenase [Wenxinia marina]KIQ70467.1 putative iron-regulated protein [Wenxinia marina DSM 24838]GGL52886.1 PKHD-type hydroxylase [Wenxinia marina]
MIHVHTLPDALTPAECDRLLALVRAAPAREAALVGQTRDPGQRRAELVWTDEVPEAHWVMDRLIALVRSANRDAYGFDLTDFSESPQVARYGAERQGHFAWHADIGDGPLARRRKLTLVVQLSEPADYEGGRLEVWPSGHPLTAETARGAATLFPSYLLHRVTPVTAGERFSLTTWAHGPRFR